jgi:hypothetical protein
VNAAWRAIQSNPGFSVAHWVLAAALAVLGRIPEAKIATAQVLALGPNFTTAETCGGSHHAGGTLHQRLPRGGITVTTLVAIIELYQRAA